MNTDTEKHKSKYALTHYGYKAWQLEQYSEIKNPRTKESRWDWQVVKFPGSLEAAAKAAMDCEEDEAERKGWAELIRVVQQSEANIIAALQELVKERQS